MKLITETLLNTVSGQAKENPRLRMNYNFHESMDAPIHRMLNALEPDTYLPPHRHKNPARQQNRYTGLLFQVVFRKVTRRLRSGSQSVRSSLRHSLRYKSRGS